MNNDGKAKIPTTPVVVKRSADQGLPQKEQVFYVVARNGLMMCRNGEFFRSCAPARSWPPGLAEQESFLVPRFPMLSRRLFERVVGFFTRIADLHASEAAVLLVWDRTKKQVGLLVPEQTATVLETWSGKDVAIGIEYFPPTDLGTDMVVFGDLHSHVYSSAYASVTDRDDEEFRAGLHVVVGKLDQELPDIHVEAVADGTRFKLEESDVIGGYRHPRYDFPATWLDKVKIDRKPKVVWAPLPANSPAGSAGYSYPRWDDGSRRP
jgi:hypothetical protein